tara:strand:- start:164 stop:2863 length:2700 start_codon:yes stop_codon:yes gene_type:complete
MITSTALIEDYLDELLAKAVSSNYENILKEIKFTSKAFKTIEDKAKERWNNQGRKKLLSTYIISEIKRKYKSTEEELLQDFKDYLSGLSQTAKVSMTEDALYDKKDREARAKEDYVRPEKENYDEGLLNLFADLITERSFDSDDEIMRQWENFKDKLEREENEARSVQRRKEIASSQEESKKRAQKYKKKEEAERKLRAALRREIKPSEADSLWSDYLQSGPAPITYELVKLIGSSSTEGKDVMAKRIKKFINEVLPNSSASIKQQKEVETKLNAIVRALESEEAEAAKKRTEARAGRTNTSLLAKSEGNKVGQMSKVSRTRRITPIWGKGLSLTPALTKKQSSEFLRPVFRKLDLSNNSWFSAGAGTLKPIVDAVLKLAGSSLKKYEKASEKKKAEIELKVSKIGNPPKYLEPTNTLTIIYESVFLEHAKTQKYENPPIDFAYWLEGFTDGLAGIKAKEGQSALQDYIKLEQSILPSLVKAVKEGVVLDPTTGKASVIGIQRRYNNAIKKLSADNRNEVIMQMFRIMNDESISQKFKGKNKKALEDIEKSIRKQGDEKVQGKTIFYYLLKAHMKFSRTKGNRNLLSELLRDRKVEEQGEEVKFIEPTEVPEATPKATPKKDKGGQGTIVYLDKKGKELTFVDKDGEPRIPERNEYHRKEVRQPKKKLVPLQRKKWSEDGEEYEWVDVLDEDGNPKMVEPIETKEPQIAGQKSREWAQKRREKLREETETIRDRDSRGRVREKTVPKYTEEEIDEMTGFTSSGRRAKFRTDEYGRKVRKSLEELLDSIGETDDVIYKEDTGLILESLNKTQKKKLKTILNVADPTEYFGHDFLKLADVIKVLKSLGVVKGDKQLGKKVIKLEDKNLKVVKLATKLRKDYERLYDELRKLIFPKAGVDEK